MPGMALQPVCDARNLISPSAANQERESFEVTSASRCRMEHNTRTSRISTECALNNASRSLASRREQDGALKTSFGSVLSGKQNVPPFN